MIPCSRARDDLQRRAYCKVHKWNEKGLALVLLVLRKRRFLWLTVAVCRSCTHAHLWRPAWVAGESLQMDQATLATSVVRHARRTRGYRRRARLMSSCSRRRLDDELRSTTCYTVVAGCRTRAVNYVLPRLHQNFTKETVLYVWCIKTVTKLTCALDGVNIYLMYWDAYSKIPTFWWTKLTSVRIQLEVGRYCWANLSGFPLLL